MEPQASFVKPAQPATPNDNMSDLFNIPATPSPRLKWLSAHGITVSRTHYEAEPFRAYIGAQQIGKGYTEDDAVVAAAKSLNIPLWNEEGIQ